MALRTNEDGKGGRVEMPASTFARVALANVGGSQVYIEPKKVDKKFIDTEQVQ